VNLIFEVFMVVKISRQVLWVVTWCSEEWRWR